MKIDFAQLQLESGKFIKEWERKPWCAEYEQIQDGSIISIDWCIDKHGLRIFHDFRVNRSRVFTNADNDNIKIFYLVPCYTKK